MRKVYDMLSEIWSEPNNVRQMDDVESYVKKKYNIYETYIADNLFTDNHMINPSYLDFTNNSFIHNKENVCLLFPEYGVRIACTKKFADNITFVKQKLSGQWSDEIIQETYYCSVLKEQVKGSILVIIRTDMDALLYEKPIECRTRNYKYKDEFDLLTIKCISVQDSIIMTNKENYEDNIYSSKISEYSNDY